MHLAAMPFPSYQGTQAALRAMFDVLSLNTQVHAVFYAHGAYREKTKWSLHPEKRSVKTASLRSGPALEKIGLNVALYRHAKKVSQLVRPDVIYAHHIEALFVARILTLRKVSFIAHTDLAEELATYFKSALLKECLKKCGAYLDLKSLRLATRTAAVSPDLASYLSNIEDQEVHYLPLPWAVQKPASALESQQLRVLNHIDPQTCVLLYIGNLDAYQGWNDLLHVLRILGGSNTYRLRVVTASDPQPLQAYAQTLGVLHALDVVQLDHASRRTEVKMANLVLVPRHAGRGVPMKLLDALACGKQVVAYRKATAGLSVHNVASVVDNTPLAMARKIQELSSMRTLGLETNIAGQRFIAEHHSAERFLRAWLRFASSPQRMVDRLHQRREAA